MPNITLIAGNESEFRVWYGPPRCPPRAPAPALQLKGHVTALVIIFGLVVNTLSTVIFQRLRNRLQIHKYLVALALWDNVLLMNAFMLHALPTLMYGSQVLYGPYVYTYLVSYPLANISLAGTVWMVVALVLDRYAAIVHPFKQRPVGCWSSSRVRKVTMFILLMSLMSTLQGLPHFFELRVVRCLHWSANESKLQPAVTSTSVRESQHYKIFYRVVAGMMFESVAPVLLATVLLVRICIEVCRSLDFHKKMSSHSQSQLYQVSSWDKQANSNNRMLLVLGLKFLLCRSLIVCLDIGETLISRQQMEQNHIVKILAELSNFLVVLDSSSRIFVYIFCGQANRFRREFKRIVSCGRYKFDSRFSETPGVNIIMATQSNSHYSTTAFTHDFSRYRTNTDSGHLSVRKREGRKRSSFNGLMQNSSFEMQDMLKEEGDFEGISSCRRSASAEDFSSVSNHV